MDAGCSGSDRLRGVDDPDLLAAILEQADERASLTIEHLIRGGFE